MRKKYPIVEVEWLDAEEGGEVGWNNTKEMLKLAKKPLPLMQSLGYLVYDGVDHIALLSTVHPDCCSTVEKIPKGMILKISYLVSKPDEATPEAPAQ